MQDLAEQVEHQEAALAVEFTGYKTKGQAYRVMEKNCTDQIKTERNKCEELSRMAKTRTDGDVLLMAYAL